MSNEFGHCVSVGVVLLAGTCSYASTWQVTEPLHIPQNSSWFSEVLPGEDMDGHTITWYSGPNNDSWYGGVAFAPSWTWGTPAPGDDRCWLYDDQSGGGEIIWWQGVFDQPSTSVQIQLHGCDDNDGWADIYVDDVLEYSYYSYHSGGTHVTITGRGLSNSAHTVKIQTRSQGGDVSLDYVATPSSPQWTVLVFLNGDNNLEDAGIDDFLEMANVGSSEALSIIVQFDRIPGEDSNYGDWTGTRRFRIEQGNDPASTPLQDLGEVNMGDPASLTDFATWGIQNFPAEHYLLVIWNHGAGWGPRSLRGVSFDDTDGSDFFTTNEIRDAVATVETQIGANLDILGLDACLMQMLETAYAVRDSCDYQVASEETEPWDGWAYDVFLAGIDATSTPVDVCNAIVDAYHGQGPWYSTQSAIATTDLETLRDEVNDLALALIGQLPTEKVNIDQARKDVVDFRYDCYVDLDHLCRRLKARCVSPVIDAAADDVRTALAPVITANETNGAYYKDAEGLSIYFPDECPDMHRGEDFYENYQNESGANSANLDFVTDTNWDEFLKAYLEPCTGTGGKVPIDVCAKNSADSTVSLTVVEIALYQGRLLVGSLEPGISIDPGSREILQVPVDPGFAGVDGIEATMSVGGRETCSTGVVSWLSCAEIPCGEATGLVSRVGGCACSDIPAVSEWGLVVMALLVVAAGTIVIRRWRTIPA